MNRAPEITAQAFFKTAQLHSILKADIASGHLLNNRTYDAMPAQLEPLDQLA